MVLLVGAARRLSRQRRGRRGLWDICLGKHRHPTSSPNLWLVLIPRLGDNGETMVLTCMGQVCTVARRRRVAAEATLGRATVRPSDRFWDPRVVLLKGLLVRMLDSVVASVGIEVVGAGEGAGTVHDRRLHRSVSSRWLIAGLQRSLCCPTTRWR